jgi:hypothetical protein
MRLQLRLRPDSDATGTPPFLEVDVVLQGDFVFAAEASEERREAMYPLNAVSILLGVARGFVAQVTGMFSTGPFLLPPINVVAAKTRKRLTGKCSLVLAERPAEHSTFEFRQDEEGERQQT